MAQAQVLQLLKEMEDVVDKDIARGILDYQTQYVLMLSLIHISEPTRPY